MKRILKVICVMLVVSIAVCMPAMADIARGAKGNEVMELQEKLKTLGYLSGKVDGDFGGGTEKAVKAFQASEGLKETGIADETTLKKLDELTGGAAELTAEENAETAPTAPVLDGATYEVFAGSGVPEMPGTLIEATGGLPDSLDVLKGFYDFDEAEAVYKEWRDAAPKLLDELLEKGSFVVPDVLKQQDWFGNNWFAEFNHSNMLSFKVDQEGNQVIASLSNPLPETDRENINLRFGSAFYVGYELTMYRNGDFDNPRIELSFRENGVYRSISYSRNQISLICSADFKTWIGYYDPSGQLNSVEFGDYGF